MFFSENEYVESPSVGHTKAAREDCSSSSSASSLGGKKKKVGPASVWPEGKKVGDGGSGVFVHAWVVLVQ